MFTEEAEKYLGFLLKEDSEIDFKIKSGTEMYRKGFGHLLLKDAEGNELPGATVKLKQKSHEYKFGCNAFMIDSFPETEQNQQYEETFASLFNLAVVPFYWSDLEPEQGKPRLGVNSPFIYRRPTGCWNSAKNTISPRKVTLCAGTTLRRNGHRKTVQR